MPIEDFEGKTFVAFVDIAGFKKMMRRRDGALKVLDKFYNTGYSILREQNYNCKVEGIFISDCGILFVRGNDAISQIEAVLDAVREINKEMLRKILCLPLRSHTESSVIKTVSSSLVSRKFPYMVMPM